MRESRTRIVIGDGVPVFPRLRILRHRVLRWFQPTIRAALRDPDHRSREDERERTQRHQ